MRNPYVLIALMVLLYFWVRRQGGKAGLQVSSSSLKFILTRWPVMAAWGLGTVVMLLILGLSAIAKGNTSPANLAMLGAISLMAGGGLGMMVVGVPFFIFRAFVRPPPLELEPGEQLLQEQLGNHVLKGESRGGKLLLTTRRLGFRATRFNIQMDPWSVRLEDIRSSQVEGLRMLLLQTAASKDPELLVAVDPKALAAQLERLRALPESERRLT